MNTLQTQDKLKTLIVDDELHGRLNLQHILETYCPELEVVGLASSAMEAKEMAQQFDPQVVFLDIGMPVLDGFDFLNEFENRNFLVIIVTAHEEFGIQALKANVTDYLLKPINIKELKIAMKKLLALQLKAASIQQPHAHDKLMIPDQHGYNMLHIDSILRLEGDGSYTTVVNNNGKKAVVSRTLNFFERSLPQDRFFRIHKSYMVNLNYIKEFSNYGGCHLTMTDGCVLAISRRKAPGFMQKIKTMHLKV